MYVNRVGWQECEVNFNLFQLLLPGGTWRARAGFITSRSARRNCEQSALKVARATAAASGGGRIVLLVGWVAPRRNASALCLFLCSSVVFCFLLNVAVNGRPLPKASGRAALM